MPLRRSLDFASPGHRFFGFEDLSATLVDDGQLRERERVCRFQLSHFLGVKDSFFESSELLLMDSQGHVSLHVVGINGQDILQSIHAAFKVSFRLQLHGCIV